MSVEEILPKERIESILVSTGLLSFGTALGVKWAAADGINTLLRNGYQRYDAPALLAPVYNDQMKIALAIAMVALVSHAAYLRYDEVTADE